MKDLIHSVTARVVLLLTALSLTIVGCQDTLTSFDEDGADRLEDRRAAETTAPPRDDAPHQGVLRHPQLLGQATSTAAGKAGSEERVHLYLAFNAYEADGVTPRVLDQWGITKRVLEQYGITRRVLEQYGITKRVLEQYGITKRVLEQYGITRRVLEQYGITARVLDQYGITARVLEQYGLTFAQLEADGVTPRVLEDYEITRRVLEDFNLNAATLDDATSAFPNVLTLRARISKARPGISISFGSQYLDALLEEMLLDPDIEFVEPDAASESTLYLRNGFKKEGQMIPWSLASIGGLFPLYVDDVVHVFLLDSGIYGRDLNVVEAKDFTMLFVNRDETTWDDAMFEQMPVYDPGAAGDPSDHTGHGTHVAGTIAAENNGEGIKGVAPNTQLHSLRVLTDEGRTDITTLIAAVDYVTDWKQQHPTVPAVMNLSLGMDLESTAYNVLDEAVARASAFGVTVVVSAGNDGRDAATYSPAHVAEAITVGAYDQNSQFAGFSNYGAVVDLLAPGDQIVSLTHLPSEADADENVVMSGTSFAAPQVTGAAALYLAQHPTASPAQVKAALLNGSERSVQGVPDGTTDRGLNVSFADDGNTKPFAFKKAEWKKHDTDHDRDKLTLQGDGPRVDLVTLRSAATGETLAEVTIREDGQWKAEFLRPELARIPCAVVADYQGPTHEAATATMDVLYAPGDCVKTFALTKAEWKDSYDQLIFEAEGPTGYEATFTDAHTGAAIATATFPNDGKYKYDEVDAPVQPCAVRGTLSNGLSVEFPVQNATEDCGPGGGQMTPVLINKAEWDPGKQKLKVEGNAAAGMEIRVLAAASGALIGTDTGDRFKVEVQYPAVLPCEVRVVSVGNGQEATHPVVDRSTGSAPRGCEGPLALTTVKWDAGRQELQVKGTGLYNGSLLVENARNGLDLATVAIDGQGKFDEKLGTLPVIPCAVTITSGDVSVTMDVENATFDCDVALTVTTARWVSTTRRVLVGGQTTAGQHVTLRNPDNGATLLEMDAAETGDYWFELQISDDELPPPCRVLIETANGEALEANLRASVCNADFTYTPPAPEWEQNAHSFLTLGKAEWNASARTLLFEGTGYVDMAVVVRNPYNGDVLAETQTAWNNEAWAVTATDPAVVPCAVEAELDGRLASLAVRNAPANCDEQPFIGQAKWANGALSLSLLGGRNHAFSLSSVDEGAFFAGAYDGQGALSLALTSADLPWVPCAVRLVSSERFFELPVDGAPVHCDGRPYVGTAEWRNGALHVVAHAGFGAEAALSSPTGIALTNHPFDANGAMDAYFDGTDIPVAPCSLRVTSNGKTYDKIVSNAPEGCDGVPFLEEAKWTGSALLIDAEGPLSRGATLESIGTQDVLALPAFDAAGEMALALTYADLPYVPCAVRLTVNGGPTDGAQVELPVSGAPLNCDAQPYLARAEWKGTYIFVEGLGSPGATMTFTSANTGTPVGTAVVDGAGKLAANLSTLTEIPCVLHVEMGGKTYERPLTNAPASCDATPVLEKAEWRNGGLTVEILGSPHQPVTFTSANTGTVLTTTSFDAAGELAAAFTGLPEAPCVLRADLHGRSVDLPVANAPLNCDGADYLLWEKAQWDNGKRKLVLQGKALAGDNSPNATVVFTDTSTGEEIVALQAEDGAFQWQQQGMAIVPPCSITATVGTRSEAWPVDGAPGNCQ